MDGVAADAGNAARLSAADRSLVALALGTRATLVTDDYTMLDVARRLEVATLTVNTKGIDRTLDFRPRCSGCGRWFEAAQKGDACPVCGAPVKARPRR